MMTNIEPGKERIDWPAIIAAGDYKGANLSVDDCKLLYTTAVDIGARTIVEIGACKGTSSIVLGLAARASGGHVWSIESRPRKEWYANMTAYDLRPTVTLCQGLSPWVELNLPGSIDLLFIDGEHKTRWCLMDYHYWSHFVRSGGRIAFHDIYGPASAKVNRAIEMILADDADKLTELARCPPARRCGTVLFAKR
jgi:predicted O-methyltransferase YrrM